MTGENIRYNSDNLQKVVFSLREWHVKLWFENIDVHVRSDVKMNIQG